MELRTGKSYMSNYKEKDLELFNSIQYNNEPPREPNANKKSNKFIEESSVPEVENSLEILAKPLPPREDGVIERYRIQFVKETKKKKEFLDKPKPPREDGVTERYEIQFVQDNKRNGTGDAKVCWKKSVVDDCVDILQSHMQDMKMQIEAKPRLVQLREFIPTIRNAPLMFNGNGTTKIKINKNNSLFKSKGMLHKKYGKLSPDYREQVDGLFDITKNYEKFVIFTAPSIYNYSFYFSNIVMILQRMERMIARRMDSSLKREVDRKSGLYVHCDDNTFFILNEVLCSDVQTTYSITKKVTINEGNWKRYITRYVLFWDGSDVCDDGKEKKAGSFGKLPTLINKFWWQRQDDDRDGKLFRCVVEYLKLEYDVEFQQLWILFSYKNYMFTGMDWSDSHNFHRGIKSYDLEKY